MFCPQCGKEVGEAEQYCVFCGGALRRSTSRSSGPHQSATPITWGPLWKLFFWVVVLAGVAVIAIWLTQELRHSPGPERGPGAHGSASQAPPAPPQLVAVPQSIPIVQGNVVVPPQRIQYFKFTVPRVAQGAKVNGTFHAFGGSGNDIQAAIMTPLEFENWSNGHQARVYYDSGQVTNGVIEVDAIPPGTYILAFSNRTSVFSRKEVTAQVTLNYTVPEQR